MRFAEFGLFGVYIAPIVPMMLVAWIATIGLRRLAAHHGLLRQVWHPALFVCAVYVVLLAAIVLLAAQGGFHARS